LFEQLAWLASLRSVGHRANIASLRRATPSGTAEETRMRERCLDASARVVRGLDQSKAVSGARAGKTRGIAPASRP
jgi:hypothetical protein